MAAAAAWDDLYAQGGKRYGTRCPDECPTFRGAQCVRNAGHDGNHRYTSNADGRSVTWPLNSAESRVRV